MPADGGEKSLNSLIRILLCDSQPVTRVGLKAILTEHPGIRVVGEAATAEQAVQVARKLRPHIVLCDMGLAGLDAATLTRRVTGIHIDAERTARTSVIFMIQTVDQNVFEALRVGATGVLPRTCEVDELLWAIKALRNGNRFLAPPVTDEVLNRAFGFTLTRAGNVALANLTRRERQVLELLASGMNNAEIGEQLHIGEPTVKYHVSRTLRKLDLRDRLQAVAFAYQNGLVDPNLSDQRRNVRNQAS